MADPSHPNTVSTILQPLSGDTGSGKIAYRYNPGKTSYEKVNAGASGVLFCGGFHSNMDGGKAEYLDAACRDWGVGFTRFDYRGHGLSDGVFADGTIGDWYADAQLIFDEVCRGDQIVIGSSMGAWMALMLARDRGARIRGMILIAPAPDFPRQLMLKQLPEDARAELARDGVWYRPSEFEDDPYPITQRLIDESAAHEILDGPKITVNGPVHILHGTADEVVPLDHAHRTADHIDAPFVDVETIPDGDHRLSDPLNLARLQRVLEQVLGRVGYEVASSPSSKSFSASR